jgi:ribosomal protein S12 methylthiotransferase accessory factor
MDKHITVTFSGGKKVNAHIGDVCVLSDQPVSDGGEGTAPSPFYLFLGSLATCAGFYVVDFCQARSLSLDGLSLDLECTYDKEKKRYNRISFKLTLPEGFPDKYRTAILRAIDLCSVKRHILEAPEFSIDIVN